MKRLPLLLALLVAGSVPSVARGQDDAPPPKKERAPVEEIAIRAQKILTVTNGVIDHGVVLVRDGKIAAVGPASEVKIPDGCRVIGGERTWVMPGLIDLHNHTAGWSRRDINDMVYQLNPELRVLDFVASEEEHLAQAVAGGVTTVLYIPGSGTNLGGFGVLVKTAYERPEDAILRWPGAMKIAQAGNPERRSGDLGRMRMGMNWLLRDLLRQTQAYHEAWEKYESGETSVEPEKDLRLETIRRVLSREVPILVHTQGVQLVTSTMRILHDEFNLRPILSHATFNSFKAAEVMRERNLPVNAGPRGLYFDGAEKKIYGIPAEWYRRGVRRLSICTDSPVVPQEELIFQASMAIRLGLPEPAALRAVTIEPAMAIGIADRVGSIEVGKDADLALSDGWPFEVVNAFELVMVGGRIVYDVTRDRRRF